MPVFEIKKYILRYQAENNQPEIELLYETSAGVNKKYLMHPNGQEATYLADLLRYESPVYLVTNLKGEGVSVTTAPEEVGEEEAL